VAKLKLDKPRTNEEALAIHQETNEQEERRQKLAEAAQAFSQGGEKSLREFLKEQAESREQEAK